MIRARTQKTKPKKLMNLGQITYVILRIIQIAKNVQIGEMDLVVKIVHKKNKIKMKSKMSLNPTKLLLISKINQIKKKDLHHYRMSELQQGYLLLVGDLRNNSLG